jgi:hypothetical protein
MINIAVITTACGSFGCFSSSSRVGAEMPKAAMTHALANLTCQSNCHQALTTASAAACAATLQQVAQIAKVVYRIVGDNVARWLHESGTINAVAAALKAAFRAHSMMTKQASDLARAVLPVGSVV